MQTVQIFMVIMTLIALAAFAPAVVAGAAVCGAAIGAGVGGYLGASSGGGSEAVLSGVANGAMIGTMVGALAGFGGYALMSAGSTAGGAIASCAGEGASKTENAVIGKMPDLNKPGAIKYGEYTIAEKLPNLGNPKANWTQNSSVLRQEMSRLVPIRDATVNSTGKLIDNTGFLRAERNLLDSKGWTYNTATQYWYPPTK